MSFFETIERAATKAVAPLSAGEVLRLLDGKPLPERRRIGLVDALEPRLANQVLNALVEREAQQRRA